MKHDFRYFFHEGISNMFSHGFMSFAAIGTTVACLLIMGTFSLVAVNANENLKELQQQSEILAFVDESYTREQAEALQSTLEKIDNVTSCEFITREQAMEAYVAKYDDSDDSLFADLDPSIFRDRYSIHVADLNKLSETKAAIENVEGIAHTRADEDISSGFLTLSRVATIVCISLIAILLIISVFIISNTIKLTTFDRREEIAIMKMVGATDGFIRWPFVYEGLLLGVLGAAVSFFLQWGLYSLIVRGIEGSDSMQLISLLSFGKLWPQIAGAFLAAGVLIGVGGSLMAIRKFLRV
ncbi:MAG: permease-like cell division protein FtsX [Oscillospiraceae bacterium]|nr:permease-like cell division protein FtsX [Oscillospiraceae bacterium]